MGVKDYYAAIPRHWKFPRAILYLFAVELAIEIAALALFGIAQPDLYRTRLWQEGSDHGWNSNPNEIIYAYANYRPINVPLPWSQFVTNYNVVIAVLALFLLLCKGIMYICHIFYPLISLIIHVALIALYAVSIHAQAGPDMSDPHHPQPGAPWYITKSCGAPVNPKLKGYCQQAKGSFAVAIMLLAVFVVYFALSLYSLVRPPRSYSLARGKSGDVESPQQRPWEMMQVPATPGTAGGLMSPTTPRTTAFNTLSGKVGAKGKGKAKEPATRTDGKLPLRHHISMGDELYQGPSRS
ncbi:MAG: hypothetical protein LQ352_000475 [Teloschistes flavicans]|nr:MAG: hypothetical protein LQ352_000475 [Teloschistes flavicans]